MPRQSEFDFRSSRKKDKPYSTFSSRGKLRKSVWKPNLNVSE